jgi:hypothetical protein
MRTKFQSRLVHSITNSDNEFGGDTINRTRVNGFIRHDRVFRTRKFRGRLNGKLTLNARFNHFRTSDEDGDKKTDVFYTVQYLMSPIARSRLTIDLERKEVYTKSKEEISHLIEGKFLYALGSWLLTVELSREYEGDTTRFDKVIDDRMFFRMTRYFGRVF